MIISGLVTTIYLFPV